MKISKFSIISAFSFLISVSVLSAQVDINYKSLEEKLPINSKVKIGKLSNGMTYYIMENRKPEKRMQIELAVRAGSIDEDDDQQGFAHFLEHMAFNGTENFPGNEVVSALEKLGIRFGNDLNAHTSFDETVYQIPMPTDRISKDLGFKILKDWAYQVKLEGKDIDEERGVIMEEWRARRSAQANAQFAHLKVLFNNSKWGNRIPIGDTAIIKNGKYDVMRRFYKDWYRPDLMAVIAVGDFDANEIEELIKKQFSDIPMPANPRKKEEFAIGNSKGIQFSFFKDKEIVLPNISITWRGDGYPRATYLEYKNTVKDMLIGMMINSRLSEQTQKSNPPFQSAGMGRSTIFDNKMLTSLTISVKEEDAMMGYGAALTELFRAYKNGFVPSEFERAKSEVLSNYETSYNERDKTRHGAYTRELVGNFINGESMPGIEFEYALVKKFLNEITIDELSTWMKTYVTEDNMIISVTMPDKENVEIPSKEDLEGMYRSISKKELSPYKDLAASKSLFTKSVTPGTIKNTKTFDKVGVTMWELSNGAKVYFKNTDFSADQILMRAYSYGGLSLIDDKEYNQAKFADDVINSTGLAEHDPVTLQKILTGKNANVNANLSDYSEGLSGNSSKKDLETMLQLTNLYFTSPHKDEISFKSYVERSRNYLKSFSNQPDQVLQDTIESVMSSHNLRKKPTVDADLARLDKEKVFKHYLDRFADASDFNFFFVGNIDQEQFKTLVCKYIASLPSTNSKEKAKDVGIKAPKGDLSKEVKKGEEPKADVVMIINSPFEYTPENMFKVRALCDVFNIFITEDLREKKGGIYSARAYPEFNKIPNATCDIYLRFNCEPKRAKELEKEVENIIENLQDEKVGDDKITRIKETQSKVYETNMKENNFWLNNLVNMSYNDVDFENILKANERLNTINADDIKSFAKTYLNLDNLKQFYRYPAK